MHVWGWLSSGFLVLVTITLAAHTISEHLHHYCHSDIQRHKVRVLAYPPVYAIMAWLSYLRYDYETVIMFFASLFESFAVYNLYVCLQAYLQSYRDKYQGQKIPVSTKVFGIYRFKLKSKFGLHFRVITDILVVQFPIWNILSAIISIAAQINGIYCDGQFTFKGAYLYLAALDFISLSIILMALFTYLSVFDDEWKDGRIRAHGMFWCVKGPIMVIFYFGDVLLSVLSYFDVIQDKLPSHGGGTYWPAAAIKNGYYVLMICATMVIVAILMQRYFGLDDSDILVEKPTHSYMAAFVDGYLAFIPQFLLSVFVCGGDTVVLAKKRMRLRKQRRLSEDEHKLLTPEDVDPEPISDMPENYAKILSRSEPAYSNKLYADYDEPPIRSRHFNALPLEPLGSLPSLPSENLPAPLSPKSPPVRASSLPPDTSNASLSIPALPPPPAPMQSRTLSHNDDFTAAATSHSTHFNPHTSNH
ncbi:organic solute transporter Ostalpha-domain-containing protein [Radiomyces spectabilis]|uniref:organic solute transporter Ostalpha-domain-containing protein n=1 Tax=Radiomyces spectabilis TaxID=64574 RepID=UPI002220C0AD|nr:organic solute transporter Ostalpha-domain-containing protein [Radiomyces spectabilis]KAI8384633.1 organic solute transporter Ostalpha-domain-containing protein [Radiomyces spectabilis]